MNYLQLVLGLVNALAWVITWVSRRQLLDEGGKLAVAEALRRQADDLHKLDVALGENRRNRPSPSAGPLPDDGWRRD